MPPDGPSRTLPNPFFAGAVPIPNVLFDDLLPTLRDTELRVLPIVARQTLGWRVGDRAANAEHRPFKRRYWIAHAQLVRRTGRASEAISRAVDALVRRALVVVEDEAGRALATPQERRRSLSRLYFRLGSALGY